MNIKRLSSLRVQAQKVSNISNGGGVITDGSVRSAPPATAEAAAPDRNTREHENKDTSDRGLHGRRSISDSNLPVDDAERRALLANAQKTKRSHSVTVPNSKDKRSGATRGGEARQLSAPIRFFNSVFKRGSLVKKQLRHMASTDPSDDETSPPLPGVQKTNKWAVATASAVVVTPGHPQPGSPPKPSSDAVMPLPLHQAMSGYHSSTLCERRMSRRARNTYRGSFGRGSRSIPYPFSMSLPGDKRSHAGEAVRHLRHNVVNRSLTNELASSDSVSSLLLQSLEKKRYCDVVIVGKDGVPVDAQRYLLAVHSEVFERMFYPDDEWSAPAHESKNEVVQVVFADFDAIQALVSYLATHCLPDGLENGLNESNIRTMCQVHRFGMVYKIPSLANLAERSARRMMNKMPRLVCASFDECIKLSLHEDTSYDELKAYALDYMRESPKDTLMSGGIAYLSTESIKAIICDQDMDVCEHTMFHILHTWVKQDKANIIVGKTLVSNIQLSYINTDYLDSVVRRCGFVEPADVDAALKEIEEMLANQQPDEKEHVLVEGAGNDSINGIYVRLDEDIGMEDGEVVYVKESEEDECCPDYGLYLLRSTWSISSCIDYSNVLYSCDVSEDTPSLLRHQAPKLGWRSVGGSEPPPKCTWNPSKDNAKGCKEYVAPNLESAGRNKTIVDIAMGDHSDHKPKRYTLRTMMNLPTDENYQEDDYHDDIDDSATSREFDLYSTMSN